MRKGNYSILGKKRGNNARDAEKLLSSKAIIICEKFS